MEVNCNVPNDLVECILSRLPVKCLLRFRSVCKEWCALIDSPAFIKQHYKLQYSISKLSGNIPHFGYYHSGFRHNEKFYLLSIHQGHVSNVDLVANLERDCFNMLPSGRDQCSISSHGCVNGVILLMFSFYWYKHNCLGLWNPSTREFKSVPYAITPRLSHSTIKGFGFDMISNDFKILETNRVICEDIYYHHVYSLRTNTWKRIRLPPAHWLELSGTDGYLNGVHYWHGYAEHESCTNSIVSFNFSSEKYSVSDFPKDAEPLIPGATQVMIALYKESIGLFISYEVEEKTLLYNVDVWVVTGFDDCGVPLAWQHLFTVGPTLTKFQLLVSTTRMDCDLLLAYVYVIDNESYYKEYLYLYNPSTAEFKYVADRSAQYYRYIESLFPLSSRLLEF